MTPSNPRKRWATAFYSMYFQPEELRPDDAGEIRVHCPLPDHGRGRGDLNRSMMINLTTGLYRCFGGCTSGSEYDFYVTVEELEGANRSYPKVMRAIEELIGTKPPDADRVADTIASEAATADQTISAEEVQDRVRRMWERFPAVAEWIVEHRGLDEATIRQYSIGYSSYEDRITIPVYNSNGDCVNLRGYDYTGRRPSKMISYGVGYGAARLYPAAALEDSEPLLLCEGEWDTLLARQHGFNALTATGGAGTWKPIWNTRFNGRDVYVAYDNDDAGRSGANAVRKHLRGHAHAVYVLPMGELIDVEGGDVSDILATNDGSERLRAAIRHAEQQPPLTYNTKGQIEKTPANYTAILQDPRIEHVLATNALNNRLVAVPPVPWSPTITQPTEWSDIDDIGLQMWVADHYPIPYGSALGRDTAAMHAYERQFNPVMDWLHSLVWDGTPRVDSLLVDWLGAQDNPYVRAVTRSALVAGVARIFTPGVKYDYMPVLVGAQGIGKSRFVELLGRERWYTTLEHVGWKDDRERLLGMWQVEVPELAAFSKSSQHTIKSFVTDATDRYREAYGRRTREYPRTCVFWGTTNDSTFLQDMTGGRRFMPIHLGLMQNTRPDLAGMDAAIEQAWAEAYQMYQAGQSLLLPDEVMGTAARMQAEATDEDPLVSRVVQWHHDNPAAEYLTASFVWQTIGEHPGTPTQAQAVRVGRVLDAAGWCKSYRRMVGERKLRTWIPPE